MKKSIQLLISLAMLATLISWLWVGMPPSQPVQATKVSSEALNWDHALKQIQPNHLAMESLDKR